MKRIRFLSMVFALLIVFLPLLFVSGAQAQPQLYRYSYIDILSIDLTFDGRTADGWGAVSAGSNSHKTTVRVDLQASTSQGWSRVASWSGSGYGSSSASGSYNCTSGVSYRLYVVGAVYDAGGDLLESAGKYSSTKTCP